MGNLELADTLKALQGERAQIQKQLTKLDKATTRKLPRLRAATPIRAFGFLKLS